MSLLIAAVYDLDGSGRTEYTRECLRSLIDTVDLNKHRVVLVDNNSCTATKNILSGYNEAYRNITVITLPENIGTAKAVNKGIKLREPGECVIKFDNDVTWGKSAWVEDMEEVIARMPQIGVLGLKRKDVMESVYAINTDQRSRLLEVKHEPGQRWYVVEDCKHIMGTCTMLNPLLLDKVGYFYQMHGLYGFDDSLMCVRSQVAGFMNCFLHGVEIEHIDPGNSDYQKWKEKYAHDILMKYAEEETAYVNKLKSVYHED